jgi:hypothetical protein
MENRSWDERWLDRAGRDVPPIVWSKLGSVRRLVLLTLACEAWLALRFVPYSSHPGAYGGIAAALTGCAVLGWRERFARPAMGAGFLLLLGVVVSVFPHNANHQFLMLLLLALLLLVGSGRERESADLDAVAALQAMRWIAAIGIFWAGVMKLVYGHWLGGGFLAFRIANDPGFALVLGPLLPAAELARLQSLGAEVGAGPFQADAPLLLVVSNGTWLAELALPPLLLWRRTRQPAMVATIILFVAIQLGAREVFFGGLMVGLLLLYSDRDRVATALPWIAGIYLFWLLRPEWQRWLAAGTGA